MEGEHMQEINNINAQINQMKIDHDLFIQKQEATYNEKLITEYNKYIRFEDKMKNMLQEKDERHNDLIESHKGSEESMKSDYEEQIKEKDEQYEEVCEILNHMFTNKYCFRMLILVSKPIETKNKRTRTNKTTN